MYKSLIKSDLIIEVWEALDCESVGAKEILAIEKAVIEKFGETALESPMRTARLLADEGAELRHAEIMELDVSRRLSSKYDAMFRNILNFADFKKTLVSIRHLENLRRKFETENDKKGLRLVRETGIRGKQNAQMIANNERVEIKTRNEKAEIAEWFTIWLQSPEIFENWIRIRMNSKEFQEKFDVD